MPTIILAIHTAKRVNPTKHWANLDKAIELDSGHYKAYKNRAKLYVEQENYVQALADFDRSVVLQPDYAQNYYDRALVYESIGDHPAAVSDLQQFLFLIEDPEWIERAEQKMMELQGR